MDEMWPRKHNGHYMCRVRGNDILISPSVETGGLSTRVIIFFRYSRTDLQSSECHRQPPTSSIENWFPLRDEWIMRMVLKILCHMYYVISQLRIYFSIIKLLPLVAIYPNCLIKTCIGHRYKSFHFSVIAPIIYIHVNLYLERQGSTHALVFYIVFILFLPLCFKWFATYLRLRSC